MSLILRDAVETDLPSIAALYGREVEVGTATFETTAPTPTEFSARLSSVRRLTLPWLVAELDGVFAGYAYASPFRLRPAYRYSVEGSVYVAECFRGRRVGHALLEALIAKVRALGLRHLIGAISDSDTSAASIALHRSLGFQEAGLYRQVGWKFERWLDVTVLQLDLDPAGGPPVRAGLDLPR